MLPLLPSPSLACLWSAQISLQVGVPRNLCHRKSVCEAMLLLDTSVLQAHTRLTQFLVKYGSNILLAAYGDILSFSSLLILMWLVLFAACILIWQLYSIIYAWNTLLWISTKWFEAVVGCSADYPWHCYVLIILHIPSIIFPHRTLVFQNACSAFQTDILSSIILF